MNLLTVLVYACLQIVALFTTKYVLSVLDFRYPMVFQGWQTLVGFFVFQMLSACPRDKPIVNITGLDKSGLVSLFPGFILYTLSIIAGSRALASIPVIVFVCVGNTLPAITQLLDSTALSTSASLSTSSARRKLASVVVVVTSVCLCLFAPEDLNFITTPGVGSPVTLSPYFAMIVHVICGLASNLHGRIADARFGMIDKLTYSYGFSLIVLAPASLYLEEAFDALHFQHRRQVRFIVGSVLCAVAGAVISLFQARLRERDSFGFFHHSGLAFTAIFSVFVFPTDLPWWAWILCLVNLVTSLGVPTHIKPDDNSLTSSVEFASSSTSTSTLKNGTANVAFEV